MLCSIICRQNKKLLDIFHNLTFRSFYESLFLSRCHNLKRNQAIKGANIFLYMYIIINFPRLVFSCNVFLCLLLITLPTTSSTMGIVLCRLLYFRNTNTFPSSGFSSLATETNTWFPQYSTSVGSILSNCFLYSIIGSDGLERSTTFSLSSPLKKR